MGKVIKTTTRNGEVRYIKIVVTEQAFVVHDVNDATVFKSREAQEQARKFAATGKGYGIKAEVVSV